MDSEHHGLGMVITTTCGEGPIWTKIEPDFIFSIC